MIQTTRSTSIQSFCTKPLIRCHHHHVPPNPFALLDTPLLREPTRLPPLALILYSDRTVRYGPQQPAWLASWIYSFCDKRSTTLVFDDSESYSIPIHCGVPQGSPLSPILFLFYISELHETVHTPSSGVSALGFADDTNLLAFGHSLKSNLLKLKNTHHKCLSWAARHGIVFSPEKYEILHFSRRRSDCYDPGGTRSLYTHRKQQTGYWTEVPDSVTREPVT